MMVSKPDILMMLNQLLTILSSEGIIGSPRDRIFNALAMIHAKDTAEVTPSANQ